MSLRFYGRAYLAALKAKTEYRVDFVVGVFTAILMQLASLAFFWVVFSKTDTLGGWSPEGVLFLFGIVAMIMALQELFFNGIWWLPQYIIAGELDRLLVYPVRGLAFLLVSKPELHAIGNFIMGLAMVLVSWHLSPPPTAAYFLLPLWVISGSVVYTSILAMFGCATFYFKGPWSMHYFIVTNLLNASRYPVTIYPNWLKYVILGFLPVGVAVFIPGLWLEGQTGIIVAAGIPLLTAAVCMFLAFAAWEKSISAYQSTGS